MPNGPPEARELAGIAYAPFRGSRRGRDTETALDGVSAVQQGLAAQAPGDEASFGDRKRGVLSGTVPDQVPGMVKQAVGQMVGRALLAQIGDRRGQAAAAS
jgi:hypothetical protein